MTTIGSLFTGYGGLDMGVAMALDPAARVAWTSDVEPGPCKLAATRWPDTPNLGDITKETPRDSRRLTRRQIITRRFWRPRTTC